MAINFFEANVSQGFATICNGVSAITTTPKETIPSGDVAEIMAYLDDRFIYHGGPGGSGDWEH